MTSYDPFQHLEELGAVVHLVPSSVLRDVHGTSCSGLTLFSRTPVVVLLDNLMLAHEERSTEAHEAVHVERGPSPRWATALEEAAVDRIAALRLISTDELLEAVRGADSLQDMAYTLNVDYRMVAARIACLSRDEERRLYRLFDAPSAGVLTRSQLSRHEAFSIRNTSLTRRVPLRRARPAKS